MASLKDRSQPVMSFKTFSVWYTGASPAPYIVYLKGENVLWAMAQTISEAVQIVNSYKRRKK